MFFTTENQKSQNSDLKSIDIEAEASQIKQWTDDLLKIQSGNQNNHQEEINNFPDLHNIELTLNRKFLIPPLPRDLVIFSNFQAERWRKIPLLEPLLSTCVLKYHPCVS